MSHDHSESGPRVALVTGASRGIGFEIARALARAGHAVALVARTPDATSAAAARIEAETGGTARAMIADLRSPDSGAQLVADCTRDLGEPTVIVNNAGTAPTARFEDTTDGMLDEVLDLHVKAPFRILRAALPTLRARGGVAVQLASSAGLRGFPFTAAYAAAKHAMVGMTRALAVELARTPTVRVYAVCPGFVDTEITRSAADAIAARGRTTAAEALAAMAAMNHIGRMHTPGEVADAVVQLVRNRPPGVVLDLDREPPEFLA